MVRCAINGMVVVLGMMMATCPVQAGQYNTKLRLGDPAPTFEPRPAVDGKSYGLADFHAAPLVVIVFTCNSCPYAVDYEERLKAFQARYCEAGPQGEPPRARLVAINSNLIPQDSLAQMQVRAEEKGFRFPYLFDEQQTIAPAFGAVRTPECFVLNADRKVIYMGAFDDNTNPKAVQKRYVEEAVERTLRGELVEIGETPPVGCLIRFKRRK